VRFFPFNAGVRARLLRDPDGLGFRNRAHAVTLGRSQRNLFGECVNESGGAANYTGTRCGHGLNSSFRTAVSCDKNGWWPLSSSTTVPALRAKLRCSRAGVPLSSAQTK
jgi:hypothetical protein